MVASRTRFGTLAAAAVLVAGALTVAPVLPGGGGCAAAQAAQPYCAQPYEVALTREGVVYRTAPDYLDQPIELALDVYEPVGDPVDEVRPVLLWMHGGYFEFGDRTGDLDVFEDFASRGFVVVTIDYRKQPADWSGQLGIPSPDAVADTLEDAHAAVAWIVANAAALRVDTDSIVASGYSAGAITALGLAHKTDSPIAAAVSFSGLDLHGKPPHRADDPPVLMYNSDDDGVVPIGAARSTCKQTVLAGSECDSIGLEGEGHTSGRPELYQQSVEWLAAHGIDQLAACDRFDVPTVEYPTSTTTTAPAPATTAPTTPGGTAPPAVPIAGTANFTG